MDLNTLEELLSDFLPSGFEIEANKKGELIIYTGLCQDDDGELISLKDLDDDSNEDLEFENGEDFEPLEEDEEIDE